MATKGNLAIKTTSIPGVLLIGDVNGRPFSNASGALLGAKQDVHLDGGTVMVVAIMTAPPTVGAARSNSAASSVIDSFPPSQSDETRGARNCELRTW